MEGNMIISISKKKKIKKLENENYDKNNHSSRIKTFNDASNNTGCSNSNEAVKTSFY